MPTLELVAAVVTLVAVYLATRQKVWCWPVGMISVTLYALVFYQAKFYAGMGLQGLYFALSAYGWWAWLHGGEDRGGLEVSLASRTTRAILAAIGLVAGVTLGQVLGRFTDASLPLMDSMLTSFSLVAQWMQARKLLEAWLIWLVLNGFYIGMFLFTGLDYTAGLYAVLLLLAVKGFVEWRRSMNRHADPPAAEAAG